MSKLTKALTAAAGNAGGDPLYVEDVFSTYVYDGNGSTQTITNDIDLSGEGGLVWIKSRTVARGHNLFDSERTGTAYQVLSTDTTSGQYDVTRLSSLNTNGFSLVNSTGVNGSGEDYASWSFRKAEKFFDVQTWTGNGVAGRQIPHSLGSTPGFIITKRTDGADNWKCYHVGNPSPAEDHVIELDNTNAAGNEAIWNDTAPTSTNFTVSAGGAINASGGTYVAYLFASDAGGFGDDENIIKCGSFTTDGNATPQDINLGFEPQFFMYKRTDAAGNWFMADTMRGWTVQNTSGESAETYLYANLNAAEASPNTWGSSPNATGINWRATGLTTNSNYIYIAIRRPMKTPEAGTDVFLASTVASGVQIATGFNVDLWINGSKDGSAGISAQLTMDRMRGAKYLRTSQTAAETSTNNPFITGPSNTFTNITQGGSGVAWMFKRATGFMDVVCYKGAGSTNTISHNLGVIPELLIGKDREDLGANWGVYCAYATIPTRSSALNTTDPFLSGTITNSQTPTATSVTVNGSINGSNQPNVIYLFATLAGVSKVGSYTGTGSNVNVDCGFSAGARWVMIKRSDTAADWYVWDSARGIVAGNDPYLLLNSTAAEVTNTDYIDPLSSGFTVTSSAPAALNASGSNYIFLAIA